MNTRKQILVAVLVALGTPLAASAATSDLNYAPLSAREAVAKGGDIDSAGDDSGVATSYPLLSYGAEPGREAIGKGDSSRPAGDDSGAAVNYALLSSHAATHSRG